ncbi:hypothetical protein BGZ94_004649 [Podila epigama]|nr:hypothetical protein BGZ94_004649 [Podila epigama]
MFSSLKDRLNSGLTTLHGSSSAPTLPPADAPLSSDDNASNSSSKPTPGTASEASAQTRTSHDATALPTDKISSSNSSTPSLPPKLPPPSPVPSTTGPASFVSRISTAAAGLSASSGLHSTSLFRRPLQASASRSSSELLGHLSNLSPSPSSTMSTNSAVLSPGAQNWAILVQKLTLDPIIEQPDHAQLDILRKTYKTTAIGATAKGTLPATRLSTEGSVSDSASPRTSVSEPALVPVPAPVSETSLPDAVIEKLEVLQRYQTKFPDLANAFKRIVQEKIAVEAILKASTPIEDLSDIEALEAHLQNMSSKSEMSMQEIRRLSDELREAAKLKRVYELEAESQSSMIENLQEQLAEATLVQEQALARELAMLKSKQELTRQLAESESALEALKSSLANKQDEMKQEIESHLSVAHNQALEELAKESKESESALIKEVQQLKNRIEVIETEMAALVTNLTQSKDAELLALKESHSQQVLDLEAKIKSLTDTAVAQSAETDSSLAVAVETQSVPPLADRSAPVTPTVGLDISPMIEPAEMQALQDQVATMTLELELARVREKDLLAQLNKASHLAHYASSPPQSPKPVDSPEQLISLKQEHEELSKKLAHLERVHQGTERDSQEKVKSYEQELRLLMEQKSRLEAQVQEKSELLQQEQERVAYEIERVMLELAAVKTAERFASSKVTELSKDRDEVIEKVIALEGRLERLKESKNGQEQSLTSQIEALTKEKAEMLDTIQRLQEQLDNARKEKDAVSLELQQVRKEGEAQPEHKTSAHDLEERLAAVTAELETRGMDLVRAETELSTLQESFKTERAELMDRIRGLTTGRDVLRTQHSVLSAEVVVLKTQLQETSAHLAENESLVQVLEQDNNIMSMSKTTSQEQLDELQSQLRATTTREGELKESLDLAKETIHQRDQDLAQLQKEKTKAEKELEKSTGRLKASQLQLKELESDKKQANEQLQTVQSSLRTVQRELKSLTDSSASKVKGLTADLTKVQTTLAKTESERDNLVKEKEQLQDKVTRCNAELKALQLTLENAEVQLAEYKHLLTESRDRVDTLEELTSIARRVAESKVSEYEAIVAKASELETSLSQALEDVDKANKDRETMLSEAKCHADQRIMELTDTTKAREVEIARLEEIVQEKNGMVEELEKERADIKDRLVHLEKEIRDLTEGKETLEQKLDHERTLVQNQQALEQQVEEIKNRELHLRTLNKTLKDEIRKLQRQIPGYNSPQPSPSLHSPYTSGQPPATPVPSNGNSSPSNNNLNGSGLRAMSMSSLTPAPNTPRFSRPLFQQAPDEDVNIEYLKNVMLNFMEHKERRIQLVPVVAQMLRLTPEEAKRFSRNA